MSPVPRRSHRVSPVDEAALRILANSIIRELSKNGYGPRHVVALASELIGLVCESLRSDRDREP